MPPENSLRYLPLGLQDLLFMMTQLSGILYSRAVATAGKVFYRKSDNSRGFPPVEFNEGPDFHFIHVFSSRKRKTHPLYAFSLASATAAAQAVPRRS
jgi:hypothetical protein